MQEQTTSLWKRLKHNFRSRLLSGLFVLVPVGVTLFILKFLFQTTAGLLAPLIKKILGQLPNYVVSVISVVILVVILYAVGVIATHVVGRRLIHLGEAILVRIPLVNTIYTSSKQLVQTLSLPNRVAFKAVVLVEFPGPGIRSFGFLTGTILTDVGETCYKIFVPTTPNPTSGFLVILPASKVRFTKLSVQEGITVVMSGGILSPEQLDLRAPEL